MRMTSDLIPPFPLANGVATHVSHIDVEREQGPVPYAQEMCRSSCGCKVPFPQSSIAIKSALKVRNLQKYGKCQ